MRQMRRLEKIHYHRHHPHSLSLWSLWWGGGRGPGEAKVHPAVQLATATSTLTILHCISCIPACPQHTIFTHTIAYYLVVHTIAYYLVVHTSNGHKHPHNHCAFFGLCICTTCPANTVACAINTDSTKALSQTQNTLSGFWEAQIRNYATLSRIWYGIIYAFFVLIF